MALQELTAQQTGACQRYVRPLGGDFESKIQAMSKKPFNFDLTGRKLFDSERKAVEAFIRKYAFVDRVELRSQASTRHFRGQVDENLADVSALAVKAFSQPRQLKTARASEKKSTAERSARNLSLKLAIFGVAAQPSKKK